MMRLFSQFLLLLLLIPQAQAELVQYAFDIDYKKVNLTGQSVQAISVGGQIPAPTIRARVGDILEVTFHNKMDIETSIHWHGVLLPNDQDGVPYLTTMPIRAGQSFTYRFPVTHHGTYWYHSHTGLQEQRGVYGAIVFTEKDEAPVYRHDYVLVFSDWTDERPAQVLANLKKEGHYYALKKDSVQSWDKVFMHGLQSIKNRLHGTWTRMGPMDIADVGYDLFLVHGQRQIQFANINAGEDIRLRLINAAASSYFNIEFAGGPMTIVAADGVDTQPLIVQRLRMAIAETYDIVLTLPEDHAYELRATAEDGSGFSSTFLGAGTKISAPTIAKPNLFLMHHTATHNVPSGAHTLHPGHHADHDLHTGQAMSHLTQYQNLKARRPTTLNPDRPRREIRLDLTGNMERYVWTFDNKTLTEADQIYIKKGENVRFILVNKTMMHHPLHLHGHFFRVLNGQGAYSPLKHTVNVPAMDTVTIEFYANEEKDWFFHCHNLYHMKTGMARVIRYQGTKTDPALLAARKTDPSRKDDAWFFKGEAGLFSNKAALFLRPSNTRNAFELKAEHDDEQDYEIEALYEYSFSRFFAGIIGMEAVAEHSEHENKMLFGARYVLPLLITAEIQFDSEAKTELKLSSALQLSKRIHFNWQWNTEDEYELKLSYELNKRAEIAANWHDDYHGGIGIMLKF